MGRAPCCDKAKVKRGPWSPEEDAVLRSYIDKYGTGNNWIALPRKAGLNRCGKSCRLRWLNYLRPDIKHGDFTEEEDNIICSLYNKLGSRWSMIASRLRGRTDNDVKNYWNTKLKKKLMSRETNPSTNITSKYPIHCSPSTPPPTPPPAFLPAGTVVKAEALEFYSEPLPFSTTSLMEQRELSGVNMSEQFVSSSEEVSATSSTVTVDNGSSNSYKDWAGADDLYQLSELDFGYLGDLLGGGYWWEGEGGVSLPFLGYC